MGRGNVISRKSLCVLYASLIVFVVLRFSFPEMLRVIGFDIFMFLDGLLTMMVLVNWLGFLEGEKEGYAIGLREGYEKAFGNE